MLTIAITILLIAPLLAIFLCLITRNALIAEWSNLIASIMTFLTLLTLPFLSLHGPYYFLSHYVMLDSLGAWVMLCVGIVYLLASIYAIGYMRMLNDVKRLYYFYTLFALFAWVMFVAPLMNNIGIYWILIEMTTVVSTFLVGFIQAAESIEAAWKYIIVVSAGISLALLGIVFFYWGGTFSLGPTYDLTWDLLKTTAPHMPSVILLLAFLLVLVGFGTKVGLAPMHTWLPDAHSEGPAPVSAMLSGALLNTAMLGIVRFLAALNTTPLKWAADIALIFLGLLSLLVAALFIIHQDGVKRLMAYSSIEHMGVLAIGFGVGGPFGVAGALYHMINHSLNKSLMFFGAGNAMHLYHTKNMHVIRGILKTAPVMAIAWLIGAVAITGAPPFALFLSEFAILRGGLNTNHDLAVWVMAILLIIIFCGFLNHFWKMYFNSSNEVHVENPARLSFWCVLPIYLALIPICILGVWWPHVLWHYFLVINSQLSGVVV